MTVQVVSTLRHPWYQSAITQANARVFSEKSCCMVELGSVGNASSLDHFVPLYGGEPRMWVALVSANMVACLEKKPRENPIWQKETSSFGPLPRQSAQFVDLVLVAFPLRSSFYFARGPAGHPMHVASTSHLRRTTDPDPRRWEPDRRQLQGGGD
jgi:hypothetical protein